MRYATIEELELIFQIFRQYPEWFAHIDRYYLRQEIQKQHVIYDQQCVLISRPIQKRYHIGTCEVHNGDWKLGQFAVTQQGNPHNHLFFQQWLDTHSNSNIWLTVLPANNRAKRFYTKYGFHQQGMIHWKSISGEVWVRPIA